jgi:hypothetical protein
MAVTWKLTGQPGGPGDCEHCGRSLVFRYEVTSSAGDRMIVGRGCLKVVTGWTMSAAQAARELKMIEVRARRAASWAAWAAGHPGMAEAILADCERYRGQCAGCHEVRLHIENGEGAATEIAIRYVARFHPSGG